MFASIVPTLAAHWGKILAVTAGAAVVTMACVKRKQLYAIYGEEKKTKRSKKTKALKAAKTKTAKTKTAKSAEIAQLKKELAAVKASSAASAAAAEALVAEAMAQAPNRGVAPKRAQKTAATATKKTG